MLPTEPTILVSVINTKLRDDYPSLDALCEALDEDKEEIIQTLAKIEYKYDAGKNKFV